MKIPCFGNFPKCSGNAKKKKMGQDHKFYRQTNLSRNLVNKMLSLHNYYVVLMKMELLKMI